MSAEGYRIRRLDQDTELITNPARSNVEPFPVRSWNEPLPIAVEGRPIPHPHTEKSEGKSLARFYPPLLLFSTTLTGIFLFLYLTKPVIVTGTPATEAPSEFAIPAPAAAVENVEPVEEELSPWPEAEMLTSNTLPGFQPLTREVPEETNLIPTTLGVEQIVEVESLNGELEKFTVSLPVLYPENMLSWNQESISEAQVLAGDIEMHLEKVREIQANGVRLLEDWNRLVSKSVPNSVIMKDQSMSATGQN